MEKSFIHSVSTINGDTVTHEDSCLANEEPLSIRVQGNPYAVVMRTPGEEMPHAAGFCLAEGIISNRDQLDGLGYCNVLDPNVAVVTISPERAERISDILARKTYISQTSCGICGKEIIQDLGRNTPPLDDGPIYHASAIRIAIDNLHLSQPLRKQTRAVHATAIHGTDLKQLCCCEDVGRHNALDKAVGTLLLNDKLEDAGFVVLSSRISYELVQKASRAKIPLIAAVSRPTALAVRLAESLNITLVSLKKNGGINVFTGKHRVVPG